MNMDRLTLVGACVVIVSACAATVTLPGDPTRTGAVPPWFDTSLDFLVADSLRRFSSSAELEAYRKRLREAAAQRGAWWARAVVSGPQQLSAATAAVECSPLVEDCLGPLEEIAVTASRASPPSITNNQEPGVDEGDIVKQYGRFLIVLHDGRLFSIDTGAAPGAMSLIDRVDVYRSPELGTWYDELLITDDRLIVTGYDYRTDASELALFRIDSSGVITHDATFFLESDDYYSSENYASRVVDGNLVLYTPLYLTDRDDDDPLEFPRLRRWTRAEGYSEWQPLFAPTDVYLPIQRTVDPVVHAVSVCPLAEGAFRCRSTGIIGPSSREFYVSPEHAYLWVSSEQDLYDYVDDCRGDRPRRDARPIPAALYRISLADGGATAVFTSGVPKDQFSLDARDRQFLALLWWIPGDCVPDEDYPLRYARIPTGAFSSTPTSLPRDHYYALPIPSGSGIENRFTEKYLVYGGSDGRWAAYWDDGDYPATDLIAVPVDAPDALTTVPLLHSVERVEVFGDNVVVDGYRGNAPGLNVSTIDLRRRPQVGDSAFLDRVLESEGRSHAFNGLADADGGGIFGLPTVFRQLSRYRDEGSNIHFFTVEPTLDIRVAGYVAPDPSAMGADYECEVSCIDWYGNARPIFMNDRVFALSSVELIEASFINGQVRERQRVSLTGIPLYRR